MRKWCSPPLLLTSLISGGFRDEANQPRICLWDEFQPLSIQVALRGLLVPLLLPSSHMPVLILKDGGQEGFGGSLERTLLS